MLTLYVPGRRECVVPMFYCQGLHRANELPIVIFTVPY
jgi:hypothetical protein